MVEAEDPDVIHDHGAGLPSNAVAAWHLYWKPVFRGGVTVGEGAVVTQNVPPHAVGAGNPAEVVREL